METKTTKKLQSDKLESKILSSFISVKSVKVKASLEIKRLRACSPLYNTAVGWLQTSSRSLKLNRNNRKREQRRTSQVPGRQRAGGRGWGSCRESWSPRGCPLPTGLRANVVSLPVISRLRLQDNVLLLHKSLQHPSLFPPPPAPSHHPVPYVLCGDNAQVL